MPDGTTRPSVDAAQALRQLKTVAIVLPAAFVVALEVVRWVVVEEDLAQEGRAEMLGHAALALTTVACVVLFARRMFLAISRVQGQVVRQVRQLAALHAVSTAVSEDLSVAGTADRALDTVVRACGVTGATISLPGRAGERGEERSLGALPADGPVRDVALTAGTTSVGTLRLHWASGTGPEGPVAAETLQTIGRQVGSAVRRAQLVADLTRGKDEGHAIYAVMLQISNQATLAATLAEVARHARERLAADRGAVHLEEPAARVLLLDGLTADRTLHGDGPLQVGPDGVTPAGGPDGAQVVPQDGPTGVGPGRALVVPVGTLAATSGHLWVARDGGEEFTERDRRFLVTLAELAAIAVAAARMRETERHGAIVAERERIARELHDSLAQVLGVTHLRLHALRADPAVRPVERVERELGEIAGICHEAYRDVREAILGLGQSGRPDRHLLDSLSAYLEAFSRQTGLETALDVEVDRDLVLLPRCEVQVIRIIQEALTNVRKHADARSVRVRVRRTPPGGVVFAVSDDGAGFDPGALRATADGYGFGLSSIGERVRLVGGSLTIDSAPGRGTTLSVGVPETLVARRPHGPGARPDRVIDLTTRTAVAAGEDPDQDPEVLHV